MSKSPSILINSYFKRVPIFVFFLFFIWSVITIIPAINIQESLVQLTHYFLQFVSFLCIVIFLDYNKEKLSLIIKTFIIGLTLIEVITTLIPYLYDIIYLGEPITRSLTYRGITGSLNVLAFSLVLKLPFLHYFFIKSKKNKFLYVLLIIVSFFVIFSITKTRGAYIFIFITYPLTFIYFLLHYYLEKRIGILKSFIQSFLFILFPVVFSLVSSNFIQSSFKSELNKESVQARINTISLEEYSSNSRLRYYSHAISSILENPFFGIGTGNWELEGTKRDQLNMTGYTVPYHVHNDFLEISAENGIVGGLLYFFIILYVLFKLFKQALLKRSLSKEYTLELVLMLTISSYLFDSMLNFPTARTLQQINIFFILSISMILLGDKIKIINLKLSNLHISLVFLLIPLSIYSSLRVYQSSLDQRTLIRLYNSEKFDVDRSWLDQVDLSYPTLATTSIPIKSFKAYFYMRSGLNKEAIDLFNEAKKLNPNVYFEEGWKSLAFLNLNQIDSARYNSQIAYDKIPNNLVHFGHLAQSLAIQRDSVFLKALYTNHEKKVQKHDEIYLLGMAQVMDKDTEGFALKDFDIMELSGDRNSRLGYYSLQVGYDKTIEAAKYHVLGEYAFEEKDFLQASVYFERASKLNPYEIPYQENLANTYLQISKNQEAINIINNIENEYTLTNKMLYIRALGFASIGDNLSACKDFKILLDNQYIPLNLYNGLCSN